MFDVLAQASPAQEISISWVSLLVTGLLVFICIFAVAGVFITLKSVSRSSSLQNRTDDLLSRREEMLEREGSVIGRYEKMADRMERLLAELESRRST